MFRKKILLRLWRNFPSRIFFVINGFLLLFTLCSDRLFCTGAVWLSIYGIFLLCLGFIARDPNPYPKIWVPGIADNRYLRRLIPDQLLLSFLWTGLCWLTVLGSLVGLALTRRALAAERLRILRDLLNSPTLSETSSLLPPSYSDCESPPPCYSQAIKLPQPQQDLVLVSPQLDNTCPTYQEAIIRP